MAIVTSASGIGPPGACDFLGESGADAGVSLGEGPRNVTSDLAAASRETPPQADGHRGAAPGFEPGGAGAWRSVRPLLIRLHFYVGVCIGPFLIVAAVTGLAYTTTPQLEHVIYRHELTVTRPGARAPWRTRCAPRGRPCRRARSRPWGRRPRPPRPPGSRSPDFSLGSLALQDQEKRPEPRSGGVLFVLPGR
ncbi:PepSY domain-containing protein [Streptomyces montanisoli]|uniref:PepSY domain-containing protein n=1 Tax=Streptomyces montanisoli TaxID=2798581 RepID=UPI00355844A6